MAKAETITSKANLDIPKSKQDADGSEIIDLTAKKSVIMTDKAPHHKKGEEVSVHPKIADLFIERGYAVAKGKKGAQDDENV